MEMLHNQPGSGRSSYSYEESLKAIEADIQHANALLAGIPDSIFKLKLVYSKLAPLFLILIEWMDWSSCTSLLPLYLDLFHILIYEIYPNGKANMSATQGRGRKATITEFYAVMLPSIQRIHANLVEKEHSKYSNKKSGGNFCCSWLNNKSSSASERDEECGICLESSCTKMVLPTCCHALCINCYRDWNLRSESCPFCRGGLKRVKSEELWVLTGNSEVVDMEMVWRDELFQFNHYIQNLPRDSPDALFFVYYEYLI